MLGGACSEYPVLRSELAGQVKGMKPKTSLIRPLPPSPINQNPLAPEAGDGGRGVLLIGEEGEGGFIGYVLGLRIDGSTRRDPKQSLDGHFPW